MNFIKSSMRLIIRKKHYKLPMFIPDATKGVVKCVDSNDLKKSKIRGIVETWWESEEVMLEAIRSPEFQRINADWREQVTDHFSVLVDEKIIIS